MPLSWYGRVTCTRSPPSADGAVDGVGEVGAGDGEARQRRDVRELDRERDVELRSLAGGEHGRHGDLDGPDVDVLRDDDVRREGPGYQVERVRVCHVEGDVDADLRGREPGELDAFGDERGWPGLRAGGDDREEEDREHAHGGGVPHVEDGGLRSVAASVDDDDRHAERFGFAHHGREPLGARRMK